MSIIHEACCDGCGKREPARYPGEWGVGNLMWEAAEHPDGWLLVFVAGDQRSSHDRRYLGYCSRRCVALGEEIESSSTAGAQERLDSGTFVSGIFT